jgi:hypothetical protein
MTKIIAVHWTVVQHRRLMIEYREMPAVYLGDVRMRTAFWGMALLMLVAVDARAADTRRVLLLHAFGHPYSPWSDMAASFRTELVKKSQEPIDLYEVSLDTARIQELQGEVPFSEYIRALLAGRKLDLLVPVGAPAAYFAQRHRQLLFPTTPMLIVGADKRRILDSSLTSNDAAVLLALDLPAYIDNLLRLRPETTEVAVVVGNSPVERYWTGELRRSFQPFANRVNIIWFNDYTFDEMLRRHLFAGPRAREIPRGRGRAHLRHGRLRARPRRRRRPVDANASARRAGGRSGAAHFQGRDPKRH